MADNNARRADFGYAARRAGTPDYDSYGSVANTIERSFVDTLTNMMHDAALLAQDFDEVLDKARQHFITEVLEEEQRSWEAIQPPNLFTTPDIGS